MFLAHKATWLCMWYALTQQVPWLGVCKSDYGFVLLKEHLGLF